MLSARNAWRNYLGPKNFPQRAPLFKPVLQLDLTLVVLIMIARCPLASENFEKIEAYYL